MIKVKELKDWVSQIDDDEYVFIDDGGLILYHTRDNYIEIGGEPFPDPDYSDGPEQGE